MNPARLAELRRQRTLVQEHLAWLDREIASEAGATAAPAASLATNPAAPVVATPAVSPALAVELEAYTPDPVSTAAQTRRGCLVALVLGVVVIFAGLAAIYLLKYRDRPLLFPTPIESAPASTTKSN